MTDREVNAVDESDRVRALAVDTNDQKLRTCKNEDLRKHCSYEMGRSARDVGVAWLTERAATGASACIRMQLRETGACDGAGDRPVP